MDTVVEIPIDNEWHETVNGGVIMHTARFTWLARPKGVGMNKLRTFKDQAQAENYANITKYLYCKGEEQ